jgi:hypothetical protein
MRFTEITRDPRFANLTAMLRVPFGSWGWKQEHPEVPFWTLWKRFDKQVPVEPPWNRDEALSALLDLLSSVARADEGLSYREEDLDWLVGAASGERALVVLNLLKAYATAPDETYTPAELALATGTAESSWRNKAAAGAIPGAVKRGKQWLLPRSVLLAQGAIKPEQVERLDAVRGS